MTPKTRGWTRVEDGYVSGAWAVYDNGGGFGPSKGSGRWALCYAGKWIKNYDTVTDAKEAAK